LPPTHPAYLEPTSPENQIENLQRAYRDRDCDAYLRILAPEFKFQFQPIAADPIGEQFWTRNGDSNEDSTDTCALLRSPDVSAIRINLTYQGRDTTVNFPGTPLDSVKIRIVTTDLQVDQIDGTTCVVSDQKDMFFRKGLVTLRENPNRWWLYEWDDLPTLSSSASPPRATEPTSGCFLTWGALMTRYHL